MSRLSWMLPVAALAASSGCVAISTETTTKTYDIAGFDSISARSGVNVVLKQGAFDIRAEGPKRKLDRLRIEKRGSTLVINREPMADMGWFGWSDRDIITVVAPDYTLIEASGGADVDVDPLQLDTLDIEAGGGADVNADGLKLDVLRIKASGGADVNTDGLAVATLEATASGGADIRASGTCGLANVTSSGGADFLGGDLRCETARVHASGGADAEVTAMAYASGRASSGGDVRFHGNPASFEKDESSGGEVTAAR